MNAAAGGGPRGASGRTHRAVDRRPAGPGTANLMPGLRGAGTGSRRTLLSTRHNHASPRASTQAVARVAPAWATSIGMLGISIVADAAAAGPHTTGTA